MDYQAHYEKFMHIFSNMLNNLYVVDDPYKILILGKYLLYLLVHEITIGNNVQF